MSQTIGQLQKVAQLGSGAFSKVFCYEHPENHYRVAVKVICVKGLSDSKKNKIEQEVLVHRDLHHANIVQLYAPIMSADTAYLMMEICEGGTLLDHINKQPLQRLAQETVQKLFFQMASAVAFIHARNIVHRDIKPANFLLSNSTTVKLADFGLAAQIKPGEVLKTACGTPNYIAPEVLGYDGYDQRADVWSLGCCFYLMLVGHCPFQKKTVGTTYAAIQKNSRNPIPTDVLLELSNPAFFLLDRMLTTNPSDRITAREIVKHFFFKK